MGSVFSRHRSSADELESIVSKLEKLHSRSITVQKSRYDFLWWMTALILFGSSIYSGIICVQDIQPKYLYVVFTWFVGLLLLFIIRFVSVQLFDFLLRRDEQTVRLLNEQRSKIIEHVKENEKFKVAKEIIEKFGGPDDLIEIGSKANAEKRASVSPKQQTQNKPADPVPEPTTQQPMTTPANTDKSFALTKQQGIAAMNRAFVTPAMRRQPARPYIQPSRTPIDKIIDYIIGDGPTNRFALICSQCRVHNGMALREEFNSMSFICFNCGLFNPARDSKPLATSRPQLCDTPITKPLIRTATNSESSDNESEPSEENTPKQDKQSDPTNSGTQSTEKSD